MSDASPSPETLPSLPFASYPEESPSQLIASYPEEPMVCDPLEDAGRTQALEEEALKLGSLMQVQVKHIALQVPFYFKIVSTDSSLFDDLQMQGQGVIPRKAVDIGHLATKHEATIISVESCPPCGTGARTAEEYADKSHQHVMFGSRVIPYDPN
ncbi:hypothetical protein UY3_00742 [Chelonia mydas]|uniref:Uncharacterized protein n=1 Tax=Chelonia mydas TaxID=8469 RepID=M7C1I1_CHEMY|nr:hypothetical protein UY3_00742 [Chelonia mydas]